MSAKSLPPPLLLSEVKLPFQFGQLTLCSLGTIVCNPKFCRSRYIYPLGYRVERRYAHFLKPDVPCVYTCEVRKLDDTPLFVVRPDDGSAEWKSSSPTGACKPIVESINKIRLEQTGSESKLAVSGPEFFGFYMQQIHDLIMQLPNAQKASKRFSAGDGAKKLKLKNVTIAALPTKPAAVTGRKRSHAAAVAAASSSSGDRGVSPGAAAVATTPGAADGELVTGSGRRARHPAIDWGAVFLRKKNKAAAAAAAAVTAAPGGKTKTKTASKGTKSKQAAAPPPKAELGKRSTKGKGVPLPNTSALAATTTTTVAADTAAATTATATSAAEHETGWLSLSAAREAWAGATAAAGAVASPAAVSVANLPPRPSEYPSARTASFAAAALSWVGEPIDPPDFVAHVSPCGHPRRFYSAFSKGGVVFRLGDSCLMQGENPAGPMPVARLVALWAQRPDEPDAEVDEDMMVLCQWFSRQHDLHPAYVIVCPLPLEEQPVHVYRRPPGSALLPESLVGDEVEVVVSCGDDSPSRSPVVLAGGDMRQSHKPPRRLEPMTLLLPTDPFAPVDTEDVSLSRGPLADLATENATELGAQPYLSSPIIASTPTVPPATAATPAAAVTARTPTPVVESADVTSMAAMAATTVTPLVPAQSELAAADTRSVTPSATSTHDGTPAVAAAMTAEVTMPEPSAISGAESAAAAIVAAEPPTSDIPTEQSPADIVDMDTAPVDIKQEQTTSNDAASDVTQQEPTAAATTGEQSVPAEPNDTPRRKRAVMVVAPREARPSRASKSAAVTKVAKLTAIKRKAPPKPAVADAGAATAATVTTDAVAAESAATARAAGDPSPVVALSADASSAAAAPAATTAATETPTRRAKRYRQPPPPWEGTAAIPADMWRRHLHKGELFLSHLYDENFLEAVAGPVAVLYLRSVPHHQYDAVMDGREARGEPPLFVCRRQYFDRAEGLRDDTVLLAPLPGNVLSDQSLVSYVQRLHTTANRAKRTAAAAATATAAPTQHKKAVKASASNAAAAASTLWPPRKKVKSAQHYHHAQYPTTDEGTDLSSAYDSDVPAPKRLLSATQRALQHQRARMRAAALTGSRSAAAAPLSPEALAALSSESPFLVSPRKLLSSPRAMDDAFVYEYRPPVSSRLLQKRLMYARAEEALAAAAAAAAPATPVTTPRRPGRPPRSALNTPTSQQAAPAVAPEPVLTKEYKALADAAGQELAVPRWRAVAAASACAAAAAQPVADAMPGLPIGGCRCVHCSAGVSSAAPAPLPAPQAAGSGAAPLSGHHSGDDSAGLIDIDDTMSAPLPPSSTATVSALSTPATSFTAVLAVGGAGATNIHGDPMDCAGDGPAAAATAATTPGPTDTATTDARTTTPPSLQPLQVPPVPARGGFALSIATPAGLLEMSAQLQSPVSTLSLPLPQPPTPYCLPHVDDSDTGDEGYAQRHRRPERDERKLRPAARDIKKYYVERLKRLAATPSVRIEFAAGGLQTPATAAAAATATATAGTLAGAMSAALAAVAAGTAPCVANESVTPIVNAATLAPAADDEPAAAAAAATESRAGADDMVVDIVGDKAEGAAPCDPMYVCE